MTNEEQIIREHWEQICLHIQEEYGLSAISFKTWILPLTVASVNDHVVTVNVHSDQSYMLKYITERYTAFFEVTITEMMNDEYRVRFVLKDTDEESRGAGEADDAQKQLLINANLNPRYRFDTFIVGNNNKFAQSAALAVAESPGKTYNPLFIYGGAGLGKTHLLQAIGHYVLDNDPKKKVIYVTSEQFTNEVIESIRSGNAASIAKVRDKYRSVDVLLIDDIQFIIGKDSTQVEFFHTFNDLHSAGKQIVITSDHPPKEISALDERFRSRFEWGLIADISMPDYEMRMAILRKYAENSPHRIDDAILDYIANNVTSNIREVEGAFNKIIAFSRLNNVELNLSSAEDALKDIIDPRGGGICTPEKVINTVCEHYSVRTEDILSSKRSAVFVLPRQVCMYIMRNYLDITLDNIGKYLGNKDHTTVLYGAEKIQSDLRMKEDLKGNVEIILKKLNIKP